FSRDWSSDVCSSDLSQWFKVKEFIGLLGLAGMSGSLGFLMATVPFSLWIDLTGWRASFFTVGIILCLCGCLLYFVLVRKPKQFIPNYQVIAVDTSDGNREKTFVLLKRIFS